MSVVFITHDLGVVAEIADEVVVMYLGVIVERGSVDAIFHEPLHPYTQALLQSVPRLGQGKSERLQSIPGMVPHPLNRPAGCPFHSRCDRFMRGICDVSEPPDLPLGDGRSVRCFLYANDAQAPAPGPKEHAQ